MARRLRDRLHSIVVAHGCVLSPLEQCRGTRARGGNVYHEDAAGRPFYDFSIADEVYDAVVEAGHWPLVELAFTPRALVPEDAEKRFAFEPSPTQWSPYEAGLWATPPRDYGKWGGLVRALVEHCVARYGAEHVRGWLWEL